MSEENDIDFRDLANASTYNVEKSLFYRPFLHADMFHLVLLNLDESTFCFSYNFYMYYATKHMLGSLVAEDTFGNIVGYIFGDLNTHLDQPTAHVSVLSVAQAYRGTKTANRLMNHFEKVARESRCNLIDLYVDSRNERAIRFYKKNNYITVKTLNDYYGPKTSAFVMVKTFT